MWVALSQCAKGPTLTWQKVSGKIRVRVADTIQDFRQGDRLRFKTSLRLPKDFQNPGAFESSLYFRSQGIDALGFVSDPRWITRLPGEQSSGFGAFLEKVRKDLRKNVLKNTSESGGAFILSLLIGERQLLGPEREEAFRKSGVTHILSISGLHVTMVSILFWGLFSFLVALPFLSRFVLGFRLMPLAPLIPLWFYVALAQYPVSALRAGFMASLFLVSLTIWRRLDLLSALALAAFLILAISPLSLFGASFQLSFMAVLFLILFFPRWQKLCQKVPQKVPDSLWGRGPKGVWLFLLKLLVDSLAISIITLAALWPILLFHFHEVSIVGLIANAVVIPLVNFLVMPLSFLSVVVLPLWSVAGFFSDITLKVVDWFGSHSGWGIFNGAISFWQLVFYYGAIFLFLIPKEFWATKWKLAVSLPLMALVFWGGKMPADGNLKVTFVDVGQGDCAVIQFPNGKAWVVDGGGIKGSDWDIGRFIVAPFLWENGIHKVDTLFLSHPHHDHYKGLGFIVEKFGPKILFTNGDNAPESEDLEWKEFLSKVEQGKVAIQKVTSALIPIEEAGVRLEFLTPGSEGTIPHFNTNDNSIVMRLTFKEVSFLLPGDLMEAGEMLLLESKPNLRSSVLKLGHHGSETSTTEKFLSAVDPKYAVISVGAYNSYGMPDQSVIDRLQQKGISVYRTDTQGAITFTTDGHKLETRTFVK
ncbi:MAG: DNA internalization-related competence protein ComEC/Rec2 [Deltaproteobacteria bacterium RIFCSPLOWO2_12_FULL_44_12]|nr:MAG: DNA internalization-related competence protein ComEC/Rec2 [Deltaproteobacteria bacterium RIFCSPHIGHO2_01_FULL_43_49]OGQ16381.1 MAG: DNA internalization-related competence protein ComEC/Rec2 [Deltaproteobacteria bacterium RIFCSPHIGHO2_02_FULL_44_53]OGQ42000.1 MAG: DNA internalization-related competence protein ComEC/Rec2 [Deltaproteobacteria bacterium RIFCSPLOWO2_02_FULL_44_34]OGQ71531.1 MAG: DNA internalization-related competence protein ComEC/Rec2 [Deltaproteobacteria bacterium RIFCSPLO